ncbi:MAG: hypothetical protein AAFX96_11495, partial [Pseudomonadota bacterium]
SRTWRKCAGGRIKQILCLAAGQYPDAEGKKRKPNDYSPSILRNSSSVTPAARTDTLGGTAGLLFSDTIKNSNSRVSPGCHNFIARG